MKRLWIIAVVCWVLVVPPGYAQADQQAQRTLPEKPPIPFKRYAAVSEKTLMKVGIVSVFGVVLTLALLAALKKFRVYAPPGTSGSDRIRVEAVRRLSPKLIVLIACVDGKEYLIVQSGDRVSISPHRRASSDDQHRNG